jgi:polygalacturonase
MIIMGLLAGIAIGLGVRRLYYWHALKALHLKSVNVRDYGAVGDGVTDDSAAFAAANRVAAEEGKITYVPPGNYKLGRKIRRHR